MDNTEHNLLKTAVAGAERLGIPMEIVELGPRRNGRRLDALIRIGHGRKARTYAGEIKKGLRPATLGAILHHLEDTGKPPLLVADYVTPPPC